MLTLADVVRRHAPAYLERHRHALLPSHVRALRAIASCRTAALGGSLANCTQCGRRHLLYHSCRHRACPRCGHDSTSRWLARQQQALLPVPYFHVVFTLPAELRRLVRSHQRLLLDALFHAAFESLATLASDPRFLGARIGALAVLHTWSRTLEWHPHVHLLVPGGGLAPDGRTWRSVRRRGRKDFLVPERALAKRFRGRFLHRARRALPNVPFPDIPWGKPWVVHAQSSPHLHPHTLLEYLGRYVHRTALTDKRLIATDHRSVTFSYRDSRDGVRKSMTLPAHEFLRRFLQHVSPRGFHRVRAYGLLHSSQRITLRRLQLLLQSRLPPSVPSDPTHPPARPAASPTPRLRCPHCHTGTLVITHLLSPGECLAFVQAQSARAPPTGPTSQTFASGGDR